MNPSADPTQRAGQLNVQAQLPTGGLHTRGLFDSTHHRLDLGQGARQSCGQTVRQQTEGAMTFATGPAGNQGPRRGDALVGAMAGKSATTLRMQRTTRQTCTLPRLLANVLLAGVFTSKAKLHRPLARTVATVAGLLLSENGYYAAGCTHA